MKNNMTFWERAILTTNSGILDDTFTFFAKISRNRFVRDLYSLQRYFAEEKLVEDNFLLNWHSSQGGESIENPFEERLKFSVVHIHNTASMLSKIEHFKGFKRFIGQFISGTGFINQLYATIYIQNFLKIIDIEVKKDGQDIDIVAELEGEKFYIHVKTVHQAGKMSATFQEECKIVELLRANPIMNDKKQVLQLKHFHGASPPDLNPDYFRLNLSLLPGMPGSKNFIIPISNGSPYEVTLCFNWDTNGQGFSDGMDHFRNLYGKQGAIASIEKRISKSTCKNILLCVGLQSEGIVLDQSAIDCLKLSGIFFLTPYVRQSPVYFFRSNIYLKSDCKDFEEKLNSLFSKIFEFLSLFYASAIIIAPVTMMTEQIKRRTFCCSLRTWLPTSTARTTLIWRRALT